MPSSPHRLPTFFVVGAPKAGTTSLYHYLAEHPEIYMSPIKEPCYFSAEIRPQNFSEEMRPAVESAARVQSEYLQGAISEGRFGGMGMEWDDYLKLFHKVKAETAIGEASVLYLWSKTAAENIHAMIPDAKVLMILRDPVGVAFSGYVETVSAGRVRGSFREYLETCLSYRGDKLCTWWPGVHLGLYYEGVKRYLDRFPRENVRIFFYDDYQAEPTRILAEIFRFLGVDPNFSPDLSKHYNQAQVPRFLAIGRFLKQRGIWQRMAKLSPSGVRPFLKKLAIRSRGSMVMSPSDGAFLRNYYREDIQKLARLLNRDFSDWLS